MESLPATHLALVTKATPNHTIRSDDRDALVAANLVGKGVREFEELASLVVHMARFASENLAGERADNLAVRKRRVSCTDRLILNRFAHRRANLLIVTWRTKTAVKREVSIAPIRAHDPEANRWSVPADIEVVHARANLFSCIWMHGEEVEQELLVRGVGDGGARSVLVPKTPNVRNRLSLCTEDTGSNQYLSSAPQVRFILGQVHLQRIDLSPTRPPGHAANDSATITWKSNCGARAGAAF